MHELFSEAGSQCMWSVDVYHYRLQHGLWNLSSACLGSGIGVRGMNDVHDIRQWLNRIETFVQTGGDPGCLFRNGTVRHIRFLLTASDYNDPTLYSWLAIATFDYRQSTCKGISPEQGNNHPETRP